MRNQLGKESGPGDLLDLTVLSRGSTSTAERKYGVAGFSMGSLSRGVRIGIIISVDTNALLIAIAKSFPCIKFPSTSTERSNDFLE